MLSELRISGLGVIDDAVAELSPGLTVLTGETGAGKTMVVTGLRLLAGGRADPGRVRRGADRALVEGRFETSAAAGDPDLEEILEDAEFDDDGSVIAMRRVGADGRSRARLGGRSVPAGTLARFCAPLLTVHGQNDQLRLLRPDTQREALDLHGGEATAGPLEAYRETYRAWREAEASLAERTSRSRELAQEADLLRMGLSEIDEVGPDADEDDELDARIRRLTESEALREAASGAHLALAGGDEGEPLLGVLDAIRGRLVGAGDPHLVEIGQRVDEAVSALGDASTELGIYLAELPVDDSELDGLMERKAALKALTRKYGVDIADVLDWAERSRARLGEIDTSDDAIAELRDRVAALREELEAHGRALTEARTSAGADLAERVSAELSELSMGSATLVVDVRPGTEPGPHGFDEVELCLDGPTGRVGLAKGASGGELSRVMLGLEVVLAERSSGGTLVFDEVDAGVGGRAALSIGRRLALLSRSHQVIAVTHLAQVAAYADRHLTVRRGEDDESSVSGVDVVSGQDRVRELARMLSGMEDTDSGLAHAEELLDRASHMS